MTKRQIANIFWGLVFIGIAVIGGVILGGIVGHSLGYLIAGICFAIIGLVLLFQPATFSPGAQDDAFFVFATFSGLAWWAWIIVLVLLVGGILALVFAINVPL